MQHPWSVMKKSQAEQHKIYHLLDEESLVSNIRRVPSPHPATSKLSWKSNANDVMLLSAPVDNS